MSMNDLLDKLERQAADPHYFATVGILYSKLLKNPIWARLGVDQLLLDTASVSCAASQNSSTALESSARLLSGIGSKTGEGYHAIEVVTQHMLKTCHKLRLRPTPAKPTRENVNWCNLCHRMVTGFKLCSHHMPGTTPYRRRMRLRDKWSDEYKKLRLQHATLESIHNILPPHIRGLSLLSTANAIKGFDKGNLTIGDLSFSPAPYNADLIFITTAMPKPRLLEMVTRWLAWERVDNSGGKRGPRRKIDIAVAYRLRRDGMKLAEIGEHFGVSKQAISKAFKKYPVTR